MSQNAYVNWQPLPFPPRPVAPGTRPGEAKADALGANIANAEDQFALEQVGRVVQKIYLSGQHGGYRHVAFSSLERVGVRPWLSGQIGKILSQQASESVCVVEVDPDAQLMREMAAPTAPVAVQFVTPLGNDLTVRVEKNLWLCPASRLLREDDWTPRADVVRNRLSRLRREFGYLMIHAPALGLGEEAVLMGQLSEGLVLVLEAHVTRRMAAVRARTMLEAVGVSLLGTILDQRTFPVPESIYRRI